jgi:hypothetical protein
MSTKARKSNYDYIVVPSSSVKKCSHNILFEIRFCRVVSHDDDDSFICFITMKPTYT